MSTAYKHLCRVVSSCLRRHNSYLLLSCCCHLSMAHLRTWASPRHRHGASHPSSPARFPLLHTQMRHTTPLSLSSSAPLAPSIPAGETLLFTSPGLRCLWNGDEGCSSQWLSLEEPPGTPKGLSSQENRDKDLNYQCPKQAIKKKPEPDSRHRQRKGAEIHKPKGHIISQIHPVGLLPEGHKIF